MQCITLSCYTFNLLFTSCFQWLYVRNQLTFGIQRPTRMCSGLQILTQIIIADITTLRWRGLIVSLVSAPFLVNGFIGSNISAAVIEHLGWRWGCKFVHDP